MGSHHHHHRPLDLAPFEEFRTAFGLSNVMSVEDIIQRLNHRVQNDPEQSRVVVEAFIKKCERRDAKQIAPLRKRAEAWMNDSDQMIYLMEVLVRCRQAHIFRRGAGNSESTNLDDTRSIGNQSMMSGQSSTTTPTPSLQSNNFNRRSASRTRVLSTLTGDPNLNESITSRSRANSSYTPSYDNRVERPLTGSQRPRSPYRMGGTSSTSGGLSGIPTTRVSPLTASNHLFSAPNSGGGFSTNSTPPSHLLHSHLRGIPNTATSSSATSNHHQQRHREESPSGIGGLHSQQQYQRTNSTNGQQNHPNPSAHLRQTPTHYLQTSSSSSSTVVPQVTTSIRAQINSRSNTPIHARLGNAITETESFVCECLLSALIGIESRLFTPIHRKMTITSTASLSTTHLAVCQRVLSIANTYLLLSHKDNTYTEGHHVTTALQAAIRKILGDFIGDIDELRRLKPVKFHNCLPLIDKWHIRLNVLAMAHKIRHMPQLDLLESLYILHSAHCVDEDRRQILDKILDYTMGVFCNQMMEWMTTGDVPVEKWMIGKDAQTGEVVLRKIPIFMSDVDAKTLLEIGKALPQVGSASDEDLESIDKATTVVRSSLTPKLIFKKELSPLLKILRDVVCGIVMRMVLTTGRLKEHIQKATSFFFLSDPRFTATLYSIIKEASMGLRVGSASLSRQTVSSALAAALEATTQTTQTTNDEDKRKQKLQFTLDAMTSLGSTPNVSSKMQFVQPLSPHYEPQMALMKPIFWACDDVYESIFHVIWAIDLARFSSQETSTLNFPGIMRFLLKNYTIRENARCLLNVLSHVFLVINSTLLRVRCHVSVQLKLQLARFYAAIDERCVDVDDVIREHRRFARHVSIICFAKNNEKIEHELANLLRVTFEAQEFAQEFCATWHDVIEATSGDANVRKAKIAEICQKRTVEARVLLQTVNKCHTSLTELLDKQITFGNEALLE